MQSRLVVGAAIVRRGTLLAARRTRPAQLAGRWELPGGKVEDGESPDEALVREVREELGCGVVVTDWLEPSVPVRAGLHLRVATARIAGGEPAPVEHDVVRWLGPHDLDEVEWLEADRPFLPLLRAALLRPQPRGVLDGREEAEAVAAQLREEGYEAWTEREPYAGEDDDADHPWAVLTDAPDVRLELLVDELGGWFDVGDVDPPPTPVDLPGAPQRRRGG